jgi:hypothetical protein
VADRKGTAAVRHGQVGAGEERHMSASGLACGASRALVTPTLGSPIPGGTSERLSTGVRDELFVRALYVESRSGRWAFAAVDAVDLPRSVVDRVRADVAGRTGLLPESVVIAATHAHTAGPTIETSFVRAVDDDYVRWLQRRISDAIVTAHARRAPARIGVSVGELPGLAFNRRYRLRDGSVRTNPGVRNPDVVGPVGPVDPQVSVMRFDAADGRPIATLTNFACHADTVGGTCYSGDFPGVLDETVRSVLGRDVVAVFSQGTSGNINHVDVDNADSVKSADAPMAIAQRIGRALAGETIAVRELSRHQDVDVVVASVDVPLAWRRVGASQVMAARRALQPDSDASAAERKLAPQVLELAERHDPDPVAEVTGVRFGHAAAMVCLPAELFVEFGLRMKEDSPFPITLVNELSNGSVSGYICTPQAYEEGGYEPMLRRYSRLSEEAGDLLVDAAVRLLNELYKK